MRSVESARAKGTPFFPREVLFSSTSDCNLACRHCAVVRDGARLSPETAIRFLKSCRKLGVERIGFTGGEPFLDPDFLCAVTEAGVRMGFLFDRITTNASWFRTSNDLRRVLMSLYENGYDGSFGVSVDAFHARSAAKPALFIETAAEIWNRPDIAGVIAVKGARNERTRELLEKLAAVLEADLVVRSGRRFIAGRSLRIPMTSIDFVPVGPAESLAEPWGETWFEEDYCSGPGHTFYVLPDGSVKPCCGYATDNGMLTIGDIHRDTASRILARASRNKFVAAVFRDGLTRIRQRLIERGIEFPGKTENHCYFCAYILTRVPREILMECV